jgi:hypothetical protein
MMSLRMNKNRWIYFIVISEWNDQYIFFDCIAESIMVGCASRQLLKFYYAIWKSLCDSVLFAFVKVITYKT